MTFHSAENSTTRKKGLVIVATGSPEELHTFSLVLSAMHIDHTIDYADQVLLVSQEQAESARKQLAAYRMENRNWPPRTEQHWQPEFFSPHITLCLMALLAVFFWITGGWYSGNLWFSAGAIDGLAILNNNQWWRLVTALTLHADTVHLVGNCLIGGHIILLLSRSVGYGYCWLLLLLAGAGGNLLNIVVREQQHLSVGFSTAVFAAIGLLTGIRLHFPFREPLRQLILPLGAGAGLLALLGGEGPRTDIGAHLFGFLCGMFLGIVSNMLQLIRIMASAQAQNLCFLLVVAVLLFSWTLALQGGIP